MTAVVLKGLGKCLCIVAAVGILDAHLMVAQTLGMDEHDIRSSPPRGRFCGT